MENKLEGPAERVGFARRQLRGIEMKIATRLLLMTTVFTAAIMVGANPVAAQDTSAAVDGDDKTQNAGDELVEEITVLGSVTRSLDLMSTSDTGSRWD